MCSVTGLPRSFPLSRIPDPMTAPPLRWGVLAPGKIAGAFADAVHRNTCQRVVAVGSRSSDRAKVFAAQHGAERAFGSYEQLVADPGVDAVYVASPHSEHRSLALLAIAAGKPVLVEKAFTRNAIEAREVVSAARAQKVLVMEAMWTRFLPQMDVIAQLLDDGTLGTVTTVLADHGQYFVEDPTSRLFDPALAGGALLDLGVYPVSFASFVLGQPQRIGATGQLTSTGVDAQVSLALTVQATQATLHTTLLAKTPTRASVSGTAATLEIAGPFYAPSTLSLIDRSDQRLVRGADLITGHHGLCYEAAHFASLVADGVVESPLLPLAETLSVLETIDEARRQIGAIFPGEVPTARERAGDAGP